MITMARYIRARISAETDEHSSRQAGGTVADTAREDDAIQAVVERLKNAFSATHSPAEVEAAVVEAYASFADRPVRDFVPVLVERKARTLLSEPSS
ncbi:hypothetical protein SUDANB105_07758 [Streptomyces sp. enrichment culture]|uniref:three-helix bundle dimerization domain-containing protein n=1 Tax=Streptomyces sp. enrichment culture TaxID=1795815 RepID=UPI003F54AFCF